jgi:hypothetical protein
MAKALTIGGLIAIPITVAPLNTQGITKFT